MLFSRGSWNFGWGGARGPGRIAAPSIAGRYMRRGDIPNERPLIWYACYLAFGPHTSSLEDSGGWRFYVIRAVGDGGPAMHRDSSYGPRAFVIHLFAIAMRADRERPAETANYPRARPTGAIHDKRGNRTTDRARRAGVRAREFRYAAHPKGHPDRDIAWRSERKVMRPSAAGRPNPDGNGPPRTERENRPISHGTGVANR